MKKKRAFAALLAAALCLGMLTGCSVNVEKAMEQANKAILQTRRLYDCKAGG